MRVRKMLYTTTTTVLQPFVRDYPGEIVSDIAIFVLKRDVKVQPTNPGEPVPEETFTHPPSWSSSNLYQLLPSTMIHSIVPVQITCLAIFLHYLSLCPFWSTSWSGALQDAVYQLKTSTAVQLHKKSYLKMLAVGEGHSRLSKIVLSNRLYITSY